MHTGFTDSIDESRERNSSGELILIRHAALFTLKHPTASPQEASFLEALKGLKNIDGVKNFEIAREVSTKNDYTFVVSMYFDDQAAYDGYNSHPLHVSFVNDRWLPEIAAFMEHDATPL